MSATLNNGFDLEALRAVVFDLDGTLIQSTIDFFEMNRRVADTLLLHGLPEDILDPGGQINESIVRAYAYFKNHRQKGWAERLEHDLNLVSAEVEMARVADSRPVPGAHEVLDLLEGREMRTAILTRGSRVYTERALVAAGLEGRFHTIICRDDYPLTEAKPNPVALERVFQGLSLNNRQCLFIGDHETDLLCAQGARTPFAAVLSGSHGTDVWNKLRPDVLMESIADLPSLLEGRR